MSNTKDISPDNFVPEMVLIPAGSFWLGSNESDIVASGNEKPQQLVHLDDFWIGRYPITNQQYAQFLQQSEHPPPPHWSNEQPTQHKPDHPVVNVSHEDATAYCAWLSQYTKQTFRLPDEKEWEKVARGAAPEKRIYVWGNEWQAMTANTEEFGARTTTPVTAFGQVNKSPYGVVDMLGNVWEWTTSRYKKYDNDTRLVVRGGSWVNDKTLAQISTKGRYEPGTKRPYLGFRVAANMTRVFDRVKLRELLTNHFNENELQTLCFDLHIDYEELPASGKSGKIVGLINHVERHGLIESLLKVGTRQRVDISWYGITVIDPVVDTSPSPKTDMPLIIETPPSAILDTLPGITRQNKYRSTIFALEDDRRNIVGTGFLVKYQNQLFGVTCAHILTKLGKQKGDLVNLVTMDLVKRGTEATRELSTPIQWLTSPENDIQPDKWFAEEDIAILSIPDELQSLHANTLSLVNLSEHETGFECELFGYPQSKGIRGAVYKKITYQHPVAAGFIELVYKPSSPQEKLEKGISGAPLQYTNQGKIIGMVQAIYGEQTAYLIPAQTILDTLAQFTQTKGGAKS